MNESAVESQVRALTQLLLSPAGIAAAVAFCVLVVALLVNPRLKWPILVLMMFVSTLSFHVEVGTVRAVRLMFPFDQLRSQARPICGLLLLMLLLPTIMSPRGWRLRLIAGAAAALLVFQLIISVRLLLAGLIDRGAVSLLLFPLIFTVMAVGLGRWLQDWGDARTLVRCIFFTGIVFTFATCLQLAVNRGAIVRGNRLFGTTGNPQQAALLITGVLPAGCYLLIRRGEYKLLRLATGTIIALLLVFLVWTGSRTGLLMSVIGLGLVFRARIGRMLGATIVIGVFTLLSFQIYSESTLSITGMFIRGDTRSQVWRGLFERFLENPFAGEVGEMWSVGESSYLSTAANSGLIGLLPLALFVGATVWGLFGLQRVRRRLGEEVMLADLITASLVSLLVGAIFEGYLLGTMTFQVFCLYAYIALMRFVREAVQVSEVAAAAEWQQQQHAASQGNDHETFDAHGHPHVPPVFADQF